MKWEDKKKKKSQGTFILPIQKGWSVTAKSHYNEKQKRLKARILNYIDRHFTSRKGTVEGRDAKVRGGSWCPQKSRSHDRTTLSLFLSLRFSEVGAKYLSVYQEWFYTLNPQSPKIRVYYNSWILWHKQWNRQTTPFLISLAVLTDLWDRLFKNSKR